MTHPLNHICTAIKKCWHQAANFLFISVAVVAILSATAVPADAFQEHGAPEGLYIHQLGHILFALSMAGLWHGIKVSRLWTSRAWRYIAAGALLLMIWNLATFTGHLLSLYVIPALRGQNSPIPHWTTIVWDITRVDNIICVAAMLCFLAGLKAIERERNSHETGQEQPK